LGIRLLNPNVTLFLIKLFLKKFAVKPFFKRVVITPLPGVLFAIDHTVTPVLIKLLRKGLRLIMPAS
jgi:hypothetical protein